MAGLVALLSTLFFCSFLRAEPALAPATIVIYNSALPESLDLAKFYAQKRGIAREHLVGLACSPEEEISREDYDRSIREPLRKIFRERKWWTMRDAPQTGVSMSAIRFAAVMKGVPLKVRAAENYPGDKPESGPIGSRNEASVDSEIAVLAQFTPQISGAANNPYFQSYRGIMEWSESALLLVCRLDAPSAETVKRMITDGIETEKAGLWGRAYVDGAHNTGGGLEMGDKWLAEIVAQLHRAGVPVVYDDAPALFPDGYPMSDCALYYGWYSGGVTGPFTQPGFRFSSGAVAAHIYSFSADSLRGESRWTAALLSKGAAASVGNVYEPYLQLTTHLDIMNDRLLHGFTFAESAFMATQALSWMTVMVGDPLYRPYASWLQLDGKVDPAKPANEWETYREFALRNGSRPATEFRTLARETASRAKNGAMIEDLGLMEAREENFVLATGYFKQARSIYTKREDILRVVLEEANSLNKQGDASGALELVRNTIKAVSEGSTLTLLKTLEQDLATHLKAQP